LDALKTHKKGLMQLLFPHEPTSITSRSSWRSAAIIAIAKTHSFFDLLNASDSPHHKSLI
jgi:uncharacterized membrane protein YukC